jgi:hypothetical protein
MPAPPPRHLRARPRRLSVPLRWLLLAALTVPLVAGVGGVGERTAGAATGSPAAVAARFALAQLGKPYQWGADGPRSFDSSGLVQTATGPGGPAQPRRQRGAGRRCGHRRHWPAGPAAPTPPTGYGRPRAPTARPPPPCLPSWRPATAPAAGDAARPAPGPPRDRRPAAGGPRRAAAGVGPAAGPPPAGPVRPRRPPGRGGPGLPGERAGMGHRELPSHHRLAGAGQGPANERPGGADAAGGGAGAHPQPARSPAGGGGARGPLVDAGGPRASRSASSWSQWPSRRTSSRRSPSTRSARAASVRPSGPGRPAPPRRRPGRPAQPTSRGPARSGRGSGRRGWRIRPPRGPGRGPVGWPDRMCVRSMAATYQPPSRRQAPPTNLWTPLQTSWI